MARSVIVVGAGLAGMATAAALARAGMDVHLLHDPAATAASDVPLAVLAPYPVAPQDPVSSLRVRGARYTHALLQRLEAAGLDSGRRTAGALLLPDSDRARRRNDRVPTTADTDSVRQASAASLHARHGITAPEPVVMHPRGACIDPTALRRAMLQYAGERIRSEAAAVATLDRGNDGRWYALAADGAPIARGSAVVLAAGPAVTRLWPPVAGKIEPVRGQATAFGADDRTRRLGMAVSGGGYVTPAVAGCHWAGATFQRGAVDTQATAVDDVANAQALADLWPERDPGSPLDRFVAIRAATRDHLPRVARLDQGIWINAGHGAHGLMTAPLAGAGLARHLLHDRL